MKSIDALSKVVEILTPFHSEERVRIFQAAMVMLGEAPTIKSDTPEAPGVTMEGMGARARAWLRQNSITPEQLEQVFHIADGDIEVIAPQLLGRNKKEQMYVAYILTGVGQLLRSDAPSFDDKSARALCERSGCYDSANHASHLKDRGNEFTGSKDKGWTLTAPGLKRGADIIKDISKLNS